VLPWPIEDEDEAELLDSTPAGAAEGIPREGMG
jgi:hypothetical protein